MKKISDLQSLTTSADTDLIEVVDISEPELADRNKKQTKANLLKEVNARVDVESGRLDSLEPRMDTAEDDIDDLETDVSTHIANTSNPHSVGMSQLSNFNANNNKITNLTTPTADGDAANKAYTDTKAIAKFGGTGADGALSITPGATNIDLGSVAIVVKNYTSISITGTASLTFTNPHSTGTIIILKSQGNVTLTSSAAPMINASKLGAARSPSLVMTGNNGPNYAAGGGNDSTNAWITTKAGSGTTGGAAYNTLVTGISSSNKWWENQYLTKYPFSWCGSSGSRGGVYASYPPETNGDSNGYGGAGGACLIIECAGAWNFTTASGISVAGENGGNAQSVGGGATYDIGGGGGGAGGFLYVLYNTLTSNSGTVVVSAGTGGSSHTSGGSSRCGAGGASLINAGTNGGASAGAGGAGYSLVATNTEFA